MSLVVSKAQASACTPLTPVSLVRRLSKTRGVIGARGLAGHSFILLRLVDCASSTLALTGGCPYHENQIVAPP